jgi:hypothetical protein
MTFAPGSLALVRGSFEQVEIVASSSDTVLVKRGSGQTTFRPDQLEPYCPDSCPIN